MYPVSSAPADRVREESRSALPLVVRVVLDEHARILRLFAALEDLRPAPGRAILRHVMLCHVWHRLADLVEVHTDAEEEICYEVVCGRGARIAAMVDTATADHDDIRAAVEEARLADVGSGCWWRAVTAAHSACAEHFTDEEQGLLPEICAHLTPEAGKLLARQWDIFTAAHRTGRPETAS